MSKPALILAPSNLGLRPAEDGGQQGAWQAPEVLMQAGLAAALRPVAVTNLGRPLYRFDAQPGTRIRNGNAIKDYAIRMAEPVRSALTSDQMPVVIGGDCSILLGCLYGARLAGAKGLIHIDGHSDFFHPGNYDTDSRLGSVAGMDLALATGRGEPLLTQWPGIEGPLVEDADAAQVGERESLLPDFHDIYADVVSTPIQRHIIQSVLAAGIPATLTSLTDWMASRDLHWAWLHVDFDVLDQSELPAVDSPGSPGLTFAQLRSLVEGLLRSGRIAGACFTIYDPQRDPDRRYAGPLVELIAGAIRSVI